jgi:hypothetical protein
MDEKREQEEQEEQEKQEKNAPLWAQFDATMRRIFSSTRVRRQGESKHAKGRTESPGTPKEKKRRKHKFRKLMKARRKQSWKRKAP